MRANGFITVVIPFKGNGQRVKDLLCKATAQQGSNRPNPVWIDALEEKRPRLIHFLSMAVVDPKSPMDLDTPPSRGGMSHLMIEVSSDSGATETLRRVAEGLEGLLVLIFNQARPEGWDAQTPSPSTKDKSVDALARLMLEHHCVIGDEWGMAMGQLHDGSPGMTVERIIAEKKLSDVVTDRINKLRRDSKSEWINSSPMQRLEKVRTWLWDGEPHKRLVDTPTDAPTEKPTKWAFAAEPAPVLHAAPAGNYQAYKAALSIAHKLLWPLYILLTLLLIMSFWEISITAGGPVDYRNLLAIPAMMVIVWLFLRPRQYPFIALLASTLFVLTTFDWSWVKTFVLHWSSVKWTDSDWLFVKAALLLLLVPILWLFRRARQYPFIALVATTLVAITVLDSFGDALLWFFLQSVAIVLATAIVLLAAYWRLRQLEAEDPIDDHTPDLDVVSNLMAVENRYPQNHMFTISTIKPGLLRWLALRSILTMIGSNAFISRPGFLGKNGVIHSARWLWIRDPKPSWRRWWLDGRLIFWSNYDGTWESYVGDFVADSPDGVTGLWSNCVGFPRAKNLTDEGAKNRDRLVRWARRQQEPTPFWYSAYARSTNARIRINAAIRQGIASAQSDADARDWLALFGSQPRPAGMLLTSQIPTLVLGGLAKLPYATCYMINLHDKDEDANRGWLKGISEDVTFGELLPGQTTALALALSARALKRLGVPQNAISTFPVPFQEGMWTKGRARALGDEKESDPSQWDWGSSKRDANGTEVDNTVDVFLVIYGAKDTDVFDEHERLLGDLGPISILKEEELSPPTKAEREAGATEDNATGNEAGKKRPRYRTEHFGFADGVSQPAIIGLRREHHTAKNDRVGPGEIVLGYPDSLKRIPPSPLIDASEDPGHILADDDGGADAFRQRPEFSRYRGTGRRDLGANGTFLVVRKLQQHVYKWDALLESEAKKVSGEYLTSAAEHGAGGAAMVWGSPTEVSREPATQAQLPLAQAPPQPAAQAQLLLAQPRSQAATQAQPQSPAIQNASEALPELSADAPPNPNKIVHTEAVESRDFEHLIAAKLLGRWRDGSPLVRYPTVPGKEEGARQNNFLFGVEDPQGLACPLGAHIRRANPRDSRFPGSQEEIDAVNRHRVLRVGRAYGEWLDEGAARKARLASAEAKEPDVGLMFMCLNADIERQYEFVQKTWILNRNMNGLDGETCPLTGGGGMFSIPTSRGPVRLDVTARLVTVRGGGYFFMPGLATLRFLSQEKGKTPLATTSQGAAAAMKSVGPAVQPPAQVEEATLAAPVAMATVEAGTS